MLLLDFVCLVLNLRLNSVQPLSVLGRDHSDSHSAGIDVLVCLAFICCSESL